MQDTLGTTRHHTPIPPWARPDAPASVARVERHVDEALADRARDMALTCGMAMERLWEAAWLSTLIRCTGETGAISAVADGDATQIELASVPETWLDLLSAVTREPLTDPSVVTTLLAFSPDSAPDADLRVDVLNSPTGIVLRATVRTEVVAPPAAERFLGHLTEMLRVMVCDGIAAPADLTRTIDAAERQYLIWGNAGPQVSNGPDLALDHIRHRMLEQPDRPAVQYHDVLLTYADLDRLSGNVAKHLLAAGLNPGEPVGVVTGRHADWIVLLLGVLRAGGIYLPARPDFPASRISGQFDRAGCRLAVHDEAGGQLMAEICAEGAWDGHSWSVDELSADLAQTIPLPRPEAKDPAYVYFTSGSTGQPKGAVCAHGGLMNHLWTKIDDHRITDADIVAQTASSCFDISLWQVLAPLVVGGQVMVVDTADQLDPDAFLQLLRKRGVTVAQIVPSYLDVLLSRLESGVPLPESLRTLSVTGEALKVELVRRWFAISDQVDLVNAYGATEVSDDTMHNVLTRLPARNLPIVNVGRALRNVRVYIVDDDLRLVPTGARGEIVFAGICVGLGYLNDPERTADAFVQDPYVASERLYRSGDYGRWLPEGGIEFLGRRDEQIKLRGLRVEIGEIQSALLRVPGVDSAAVLVSGAGANARLTAFYTGPSPVAPRDVHELLAGSLPEYMVPPFIHQLDALPLNENGKVDKPALRKLAGELQSEAVPFESPSTPTEELLAAAWAEALGVPVQHIGRRDDFFQAGGTSLAAVQLVMRLNKKLSLRDIAATPVLCNQAALIDSGAQPSGSHRLLQSFERPTGTAAPLMVCLPSAAGNALNFRLTASAAHDAGIDLLALEPRGHDVSRPEEPLMDLERTVDLIAGDVARMGHDEVHLWGQGSGAAMAIAIALELSQIATPPIAVHLIDATISDPSSHEAAAVAAEALSDADVISILQSTADYVEVSGMDLQRRQVVAAAYRHDLAASHRYLARVAADPAGHRIGCALSVLLSPADREGVPGSSVGGWDAIAADVVCEEFSGSASEILRSRPELLVRRIAALRGTAVVQG